MTSKFGGSTFRPGPPATSTPPAVIELTYSPDDGGHYAVIYGRSGQELHTTELADDEPMAHREAREWVQANGYFLSHVTRT